MGKWNIKKIFVVVLAFMMVTGMLVSCGPKLESTEKDELTKGDSSESEVLNSETSTDDSLQPEDLELPIAKEEPIELTMWATLKKAATTMNDFNQKSFYQELERLTCIP